MRSNRVLTLTLALSALAGMGVLWLTWTATQSVPLEGERHVTFERGPAVPDEEASVDAEAEGDGPRPATNRSAPPAGERRRNVERPRDPPTLEGPDPVRLFGRVVNKTGRPVAGARVFVAPYDGARPWPLDAPLHRLAESQTVSDTTDAVGRFALGGLDVGYHRIAVRGRALAHIDLEGLWLPRDAVDVGDLRLLPGFALEGHVLDPGGRGVVGAEIVRLDPVLHRDPLEANVYCGALLGRSSQRGSFLVGGLDPGPFTLLVSHPDHPEQVVTGWARETSEPLNVVLDSGYDLSGRVHGVRSGEAFSVHAIPLKQLLRTSERAPDTSFERMAGYREAATLGDGRFTLTGLPLGSRTYLQVRPLGRRIDDPEGFLTWALAEPGRGVRMDLVRGVTLTCSVEDETGDALEGFGLKWRGAYPTRALTPARGHVFWEGLRPQTAALRNDRWVASAALRLTAPGYEPLELGRLAFHSGEVLDLGVLRPTPLLPLEVRVVDERTGHPVSGASVSAGGEPRRTRRDGRVTVARPQRCTAVRVQHPRFATEVQPLVRVVTGEVTVSVAPGSMVAVTVTDSAGRPVPQAEVLVTRWDENAWSENVRGAPVTARAFPDAEGRVYFSAVELGRSFFAARLLPRLGGRLGSALHWTEVDVAPGEQVDLALVVPRLETLHGEVRLGREPLAGAELQLERGPHEFAGLTEAATQASFRETPARARADERGRFVFPHLTEGDYSLTVRHAASALLTRRAVRVGKGAARIDVGDTRLRGHVVDADGAPVSGVAVSVRAHLPPIEELGQRFSELQSELPILAETTSDESGWFQFDAFPPGVACDLRFEDRGQSAAVTALVLRPGVTESLVVPLERHGFLLVETRSRSRARGEELAPFLIASSADRPRASGLRVEPLAGLHEVPPGTWSVRIALVHEGEIVTWFGPPERIEVASGSETEVTLAFNERRR
jgi:hypothetical protein